jgi:retron-type reverse transcriptase
VKTYRNLFDQITSFENLLSAARKAQLGKRFKAGPALFNLNLERELLSIQQSLLNRTYRHGPYRDFFVFDPKRRLISAAPYRDRVVHHALCNVIEPIFERSFIHDSYACRKGKGSHAAVRRYTEFARKNRYVLKCDIQKYFQSVDHAILLDMVSQKIRCPGTLWLIESVVASRRDTSVVFYFKGDDLFSPYQRPRAIPIGNLTSQFFANVYLNGFDHLVKDHLRCKYYIRYVDDFVVFDNSKEKLRGVKAELETYLGSLRLCLHRDKSRVYRVKDGVRFLGYRIFPTHRLVAKANILAMRRRLRRYSRQYRDGEMSLDKVRQCIQSWIGHACHADSYRLRSRLLAGAAFQRGEAGGAPWGLVEQQP